MKDQVFTAALLVYFLYRVLIATQTQSGDFFLKEHARLVFYLRCKPCKAVNSHRKLKLDAPFHHIERILVPGNNGAMAH